MNYTEKYELWKTDPFFDENTKAELSALTDEKEIEDRFYKELEFGTGGLRGIMGSGTNRMNKYTVGRATLGLSLYLLDTFGAEKCRECGVAVGYDTRNNSAFFADVVSKVLSGMGISVHLHTGAIPTPQLSFAVKRLDAVAGVVITASHNPKEYNGYKVYDEYGCQLVPHKALDVTKYIDTVKDYTIVDFDGKSELINPVDTLKEYSQAVLQQSRLNDLKAKSALNIVYTPIHGTGFKPVTHILALDGFTNVITVEEQVKPDGDFPTVVSPNPEEKSALNMALDLAQKNGADIVLGTDPDADRVGVAIKTKNGYELLTGNQIGALLVDFVMSNTKAKKPAVINTVVTSQLGAEIARRNGAEVFSTLTGFKFIGEKITQFEKAKNENDSTRDYDFVMGYEESYGYLAGTHARDKDAAVSCMLICEMAARYLLEGKTLLDRLEEIYQQYGYYYDALDSFTLKGKEGLEKIKLLMKELTIIGADPLLLDPPSPKSRKIEFFGDSITCGYGVLAEESVTVYNTYEQDSTKAYAFLTAQAFDAELRSECISGQGIICNCDGKVDYEIPKFF
ncbi:MAG: phospho-sugar mutase, partial [Clostridia bacterium]|nr:phospho-sugar mutase [Clostridia bacterium]